MLWKCCTQYASKFGKLSSGHRTGKGQSVFIPIPKKGNAKECSNYHTIAFISHTSKVMLKILQARLQQYMNWELPDVQAGFRKGRGTSDQIANICWIIEKAREFQKTSISALLITPRPSTVWITINCGKFWRRWNSSWAIWNPERWCCERATLNIPANLQNSAGATGLENVISITSYMERPPSLW